MCDCNEKQVKFWKLLGKKKLIMVDNSQKIIQNSVISIDNTGIQKQTVTSNRSSRKQIRIIL